MEKDKKMEAEIYDKIREDNLYESKNFLKRSIFNKRFEYLLKLSKKRGNVLDVGCGEGYFIRFADKRFDKYTGIDISSERLKNAREKITGMQNIQLMVCDAEKTPFKNESFDAIFAADVLEHIKNLDAAIDEIYRIIKNDGELIISIPTENAFYHLVEKITGGKSFFHYHNSKKVNTLLKRKFKLKKTRGIPFVIPIHSVNIFMVQKWMPK